MRRTKGESEYTHIATVNEAFYVDNNVEEDTVYYYQVKAEGNDHITPASNTVGPISSKYEPYGLPYSKDFLGGETEGWTFNDGEYVIKEIGEDKCLVATTSSAVAVTGDKNWDDYSIKTKLYVEDVQEGAEVGIVLRYTDENNYYRFQLSKNNNALELVRVKDGIEVLLESVDLSNMPLEESKNRYSISASITGDYLWCSVSTYSNTAKKKINKEISYLDNDGLATGSTGYYFKNSTPYYDGLLVEQSIMDTFIDPALSTWHPVSGIWELEIENQQGTYVQSNMGRKQWHIAYTGNALLNDFYYSGKIEIQKGLKAGIFFRYQDENNYYRLEVHSNGMIRLIKKVNGIEEELLCRTMATNIQGVNVFSIACFNNRIEIYLNTEFVARQSHETF